MFEISKSTETMSKRKHILKQSYKASKIHLKIIGINNEVDRDRENEYLGVERKWIEEKEKQARKLQVSLFSSPL